MHRQLNWQSLFHYFPALFLSVATKPWVLTEFKSCWNKQLYSKGYKCIKNIPTVFFICPNTYKTVKNTLLSCASNSDSCSSSLQHRQPPQRGWSICLCTHGVFIGLMSNLHEWHRLDPPEGIWHPLHCGAWIIVEQKIAKIDINCKNVLIIFCCLWKSVLVVEIIWLLAKFFKGKRKSAGFWSKVLTRGHARPLDVNLNYRCIRSNKARAAGTFKIT